jgi:hypothetical protein
LAKIKIKVTEQVKQFRTGESKMATLTKHGKEIGRIEYKTSIEAYFENGDILVNHGFGWKEYGKVKPGINPIDVYNKKRESLKLHYEKYPIWKSFVSELHEIAGIKDRWKLFEAVKMMPDDPDGVWSEVCDGYGDNLHASIEEIVILCRKYKAVEREANRS